MAKTLSTFTLWAAIIVAIALVAAAAWWYFVGSAKLKERFFGAGFVGPKGPKGLAAAAAKGAAAISGMSPKEKELFQNLQNNSFTTTQIDDMIQSGILNAKVVNKFLSALNVVV